MFHQALQKERIIDLGEIHSICFPPRWIEMPVRSFGKRIVRKFSPIDFPDVRICSILNTDDLDPVPSTNFQRILCSEFHDLTIDEIEDIEDILKSIADKVFFEIEVARTGFLNQRRVLKLSGKWLQTNEQMIGGFIDSVGTDNHIQQIYFVAPTFHYHAFEADALESLMSVIWKESKI